MGRRNVNQIAGKALKMTIFRALYYAIGMWTAYYVRVVWNEIILIIIVFYYE